MYGAIKVYFAIAHHACATTTSNMSAKTDLKSLIDIERTLAERADDRTVETTPVRLFEGDAYNDPAVESADIEKSVSLLEERDLYVEKKWHPSFEAVECNPRPYNARSWFSYPIAARDKAEAYLKELWERLDLSYFKHCRPIIAGGRIEHCFNEFMLRDSIENGHGEDAKRARRYVEELQGAYACRRAGRDVDVFLCYDDEHAGVVADELRRFIIDHMRSYRVISVTSAGYTVSFDKVQYSPYDDEYIDIAQFIPANGATPASVINAFDLDCCCAYFDGKEIMGLPRAFRAWRTHANVFRPHLVSRRFEQRVKKYTLLAYDLLIPPEYGFDPTLVDYDETTIGGGFLSLMPYVPMERGTATAKDGAGRNPEHYFDADEKAPYIEWREKSARAFINDAYRAWTASQACDARSSSQASGASGASERLHKGRVYYPGRHNSVCYCRLDSEAHLVDLRAFLEGRYGENIRKCVIDIYARGMFDQHTGRVHAIRVGAGLSERLQEITSGAREVEREILTKIDEVLRDTKFASLASIVASNTLFSHDPYDACTDRQRVNWFCYGTCTTPIGDPAVVPVVPVVHESAAVPEPTAAPETVEPTAAVGILEDAPSATNVE